MARMVACRTKPGESEDLAVIRSTIIISGFLHDLPRWEMQVVKPMHQWNWHLGLLRKSAVEELDGIYRLQT